MRPILICPACSGTKPAGKYLCHGCWYTLRPPVRAALSRRDDLAVRRLSDLLEQLRNGVALHQIQITR
jgi:hypothetical protein